MLAAAIRDFCKDESILVTTLLGPNTELPQFDEKIRDRIRIERIHDPVAERSAFRKHCSEAEAVLLVAPEFDQILLGRADEVSSLSSKVLISPVEMLKLFSSKYRTVQAIEEHSISVIETNQFNNRVPCEEYPFPIVIKPDDGAGSTDTFLINSADHLKELLEKNPELNEQSKKLIWQLFLKGESFSVAALGSLDAEQFQVLPVARQKISDEGFFHYEGGEIPYKGPGAEEMKSVVEKIMNRYPDLGGYIGFDFILPDNDQHNPVLMEVNPRLTTSFIGYSELTDVSILSKILDNQSIVKPIDWKDVPVSFLASGELLENSA